MITIRKYRSYPLATIHFVKIDTIARLGCILYGRHGFIEPLYVGNSWAHSESLSLQNISYM